MPDPPDPSQAGMLDVPRWLREAGSRLRHPFRHYYQPGRTPDHVVVRLSGEITSRNAERIGQRLQDELRSHPAVLEIDVGDVRYLTPDGSAAFFMALRAARTYGTRVTVTHVRSEVRRVLQQLGLERVLEVYEGDGPLGP